MPITKDEKRALGEANKALKPGGAASTTLGAGIYMRHTIEEAALIVDALEILNPASEEGREIRLRLLRDYERELAGLLAKSR